MTFASPILSAFVAFGAAVLIPYGFWMVYRAWKFVWGKEFRSE